MNKSNKQIIVKTYTHTQIRSRLYFIA